MYCHHYMLQLPTMHTHQKGNWVVAEQEQNDNTAGVKNQTAPHASMYAHRSFGTKTSG